MSKISQRLFEVDNAYYNIVLTNDSYNGDIYQAKYSENRTTPIIDNPSDYYLTVSQLSVPSSLIPLFFFEVQTGQANPNLGIYSFTIQNIGTGDNYQEFTIYIPGNLLLPTPAPPLVFQERSRYYFMYSYTDIITLFNNALLAAYNAYAAVHGPIVGGAPYFIYTATTGLISLIVPYGYIGVANIYFNIPALQLFESFKGTYIGNSVPDGTNWRFSIDTSNNNGFQPNNGVIPTPPNFLIFTQEYQNYKLWYPLRSIVLTSNTITVLPEYQVPVTDVSRTSTGQTVARPIITDFSPDLVNAGLGRTGLVYFPSGPYRLIDLIGQSPLNKIDIEVWWSDRNNFLYPIYITYGETFSLKLLFIRKQALEERHSIESMNATLGSGPKRVQYRFA